MATTTPAGVRGGHAKQGSHHHSSDGAPMTHRQIMEALTGLLLGMFVAMLSSTIVSNALPEIIRDLDGTQSAYTWVVTAALLSMTVTTPLWGKLADLFSKKLLVQIALVIFVIGSALAGISQNTGTLIAFRVLQGIGTGGLVALSQIVIAAMIPPRERGRYAGYIGATFAVATVGGPLLGGVITDTDWLGWRWCFYVGVPFAAIALVLLQKTLKLPVVRRKVKIDWLGAFFLAASVSLLMIWVTLAGDDYDWISWQTYAMVGGSVLLGLIFVVVETKAAEPLIPLRFFRNRTIALTSFASLFVGVAMFGSTVFLSQYFQLARDKSPTMSGVMTIPMIAGLFVSSTVSGQIITKTGRWKGFLVGGGVGLVAGLGLLSTITYDTEYWKVAVYMAVLGLGLGMMMQNLVLASQNQVKPAELGAASSLVTFTRSLGGAVGVSALGAVLSSRITHYVEDGLAALHIKPGGAAAGGNTIPDMDALPKPIRTVMESAYGDGIADLFLYAAPIALVGLVLVLFVKEVALKSSNDDAPQSAQAEPGTETDDAAGATQAPVAAAPPATGRTLHGTVRTAEGAAVSHAAVTLISLAGRQLGRAVAQDGRYALDAPAAGSYVLIASADGFQPQASTVVVADEPVAYDILLSGTSGLTGTVRTADGGLPVGDAMVVVTDVRGDVLATGKSAEGGEFVFGELIPGTVTVAVNAAGFRPAALPVEIGGQGVTRVEVVLRSGALVRGTVRGGAGRRPLADARVTLMDAAGNVVAGSTTGDDGAYAFADLDAGEYTVVATGYPPVAGALTVTGRGVDGHDIELAHPGE
ncbi:transporter [Streptomyces agglomeratus]|uniref:MFS transporter n=1 Tax=Streptomyces agglomeratus TaxID=285458 RepID=UPI0008543B02|nr:MFS transporter [Streptomyces agglomeratus]OEJ39819.1 transporter [Streptomyces agglomeratus]OEJ45802.1 transporter [Streptomyces agglomeratus]